MTTRLRNVRLDINYDYETLYETLYEKMKINDKFSPQNMCDLKYHKKSIWKCDL